MHSVNNFAETIVYGAVCFFSFMLLAYYPLRYFRRFNKKIMFSLEVAFSIPEMIFFLLAIHYTSEHIAPLVFVIIVYNIFAYKLLYKTNLGRILFNLLLIVNLANFTVTFAKLLKAVLFPAAVGAYFQWADSGCVLITEMIFMLPIFFYIKHYSDSMVRNNAYDYIWRYAWVVPLILSILGSIMIYTPNLVASSEIALYGRKSVICALIALCMMLNYSFIAMLINKQHGIQKLEKNLYHQSLQQMQYHQIEKEIKDTRIMRHDLRHHINLMRSYFDNNEFDKLKNYLYQYCQSVDQISQLHYSNNPVLNTLLVYYADRCRSSRIPFEAKVSLSDKLPLMDNETSILFGNLLENAYQACLEMNEDQSRHISITASIRSNTSLFIIENTYSNNIMQDSIGNFLSTKSDGSGIGLISVKEIISKYDGYIDFQTNDGIFSTSFSLYDKLT